MNGERRRKLIVAPLRKLTGASKGIMNAIEDGTYQPREWTSWSSRKRRLKRVLPKLRSTRGHTSEYR
jgi:hypothetical protein